MSDSSETLKAVLTAMGIDEVDSMSYADLADLARTLGVDVPEQEHEALNVTSSGGPTGAEEEPHGLDTAFIAEEGDMLPSGQTAGAETGASTEDDDHTHDDTISAFCSITGGEPSAARHLLEAFGWDLEGAVSMYLEQGGTGGAFGEAVSTPPSSAPGGTRTFGTNIGQNPGHMRLPTGGDDSDDDNTDELGPSARRPMMGIGGPDNSVLMPPMPGMPGTEFTHQRHLDNILGSLMRASGESGMQPEDMRASMADFMAAYEQQQQGGRRAPDRYDEDGVRLPDPVQRQRLVPAGGGFRFSRSGAEALGRAEDPSVEWMFPPARHLSSQEPLEQVREEAQKDGRWILVNIQTHEEFSSHMLNRDTWVNDTIESILRTTFVFWQRGHTSGDGAAYMRMHRLSEDDLPHIGVIDPRTGAKLLTLTGFIPPEDLAIRLMEFAERHPQPFATARGSAAPSQGGSGAHSRANSTDGESAVPSGVSSGDTSTCNLSSLDGTGAGKGSAYGTATGTPQSSAAAPGIAALRESLGEMQVRSGEKRPAVPDYGEVPAEPAEGEEGSIKVSIKLSNGKAFARRYRKSDFISALFAVAASVDNEARDRGFDLVSRFPPLSLLSCRDQTLEACGLAGAQVIVKFL